MYLQFLSFIERWKKIFSRNKINYFVYILTHLNVQSVIKYTVLFNLMGKKPIIEFQKKNIFHRSLNVKN